MAAQAQPSNRREEVQFPPNVPVTVSLRYAQGKIVSGINGERVMLSTTDNRVMFVDPEIAGQIERLGVNVREPFTITKRHSGKKDDPITWDVQRTIVPGEQKDGTFAVPASAQRSHDAGSAGAAAPSKPMAAATAANPSDTARSILVREADALVDAYALVLERALTTYGGRIKPDEVRSLLLSAYIQRQKFAGAV